MPSKGFIDNPQILNKIIRPRRFSQRAELESRHRKPPEGSFLTLLDQPQKIIPEINYSDTPARSEAAPYPACACPAPPLPHCPMLHAQWRAHPG